MARKNSEEEQDLVIPILSKLFRRELWGGSYTTVENCMTKIPKHDRGAAKKELEEMEKDGLVILHKGSDCVSLNPAAKDRIEDILEDEVPGWLL